MAIAHPAQPERRAVPAKTSSQRTDRTAGRKLRVGLESGRMATSRGSLPRSPEFQRLADRGRRPDSAGRGRMSRPGIPGGRVPTRRPFERTTCFATPRPIRGKRCATRTSGGDFIRRELKLQATVDRPVPPGAVASFRKRDPGVRLWFRVAGSRTSPEPSGK